MHSKTQRVAEFMSKKDHVSSIGGGGKGCESVCVGREISLVAMPRGMSGAPGLEI